MGMPAAAHSQVFLESSCAASERCTPAAQVDVYSFSMIAYSLFEHCQPFAGMDPVEAARQSALYDKRPQLMKLGGKSPNMQARRAHMPKI